MEAFKKFSQHSLEERFAETYKQRTFFERYYPIYLISLIFALIFQLLSALSGYRFFSDILSVKISSAIWLFVATVTAQIIIEVLKYFVVGTVFRDLFAIRTKPDIGLIVVAILLSCLSVYSSVIGGGKYGIDNEKVTTTFERYDTEIKTIRAEIEAIKHRNTWKGQTWLNKKEKDLLYQKEKQLSNAIAAKENALAKVTDENALNEITYRYGFALFELGFLLCMFFQHRFGSRVAIEAGLINANFKKLYISFDDFTETAIDKANEQTRKMLEHLQQTAPPPISVPPPSRIGFTFAWQQKSNENRTNENRTNENRTNENRTNENRTNENRTNENRTNENRIESVNEGNRICNYCNKPYIYKHHKQMYCTEDCRISAWEKRHGKPFKRKK